MENLKRVQTCVSRWKQQPGFGKCSIFGLITSKYEVITNGKKSNARGHRPGLLGCQIRIPCSAGGWTWEIRGSARQDLYSGKVGGVRELSGAFYKGTDTNPEGSTL